MGLTFLKGLWFAIIGGNFLFMVYVIVMSAFNGWNGVTLEFNFYSEGLLELTIVFIGLALNIMLFPEIIKWINQEEE